MREGTPEVNGTGKASSLTVLYSGLIFGGVGSQKTTYVSQITVNSVCPDEKKIGLFSESDEGLPEAEEGQGRFLKMPQVRCLV